MKSKLAAILLVMLGLAAARADTNTYSQTDNQVLADDNGTGWFTTLNVSGASAISTHLSVTLNITGGFNGDLYMYLVNPNGDIAVLLNRVGLDGSNPAGYSDSGFSITLSDISVNDLHYYQNDSPQFNGFGQLTGTWAADGREVNSDASGFNPSDFDTAPQTAGLGNLLGSNPNGDWTLFAADLSGGPAGDQSSIVSWSLQLESVPEPATGSMLILAGALFGIYFRRRHSQRKQNSPGAL
ncbi:MAG TPA: PEP-CTERM sorting domain-containing protein [Verrucomicrobiae bacterium]|jgi:subtilisin-like proprotein convertase family protein